jgi:predicted acetyltransferase
MDWDVRPCSDIAEQRDAVSAIFHYFGRSAPRDEQMTSLTQVMPPERMHATWDAGRIVAGAGAFPFQLTVPGGRVPAAGVSVVGVLPTHRRRGVLTAMMRAQLDDCRARGEPVAALWASEDRIYGRFGYGLTSLAYDVDVPRERTTFRVPVPPCGRTRLVPPASAASLVAPVWERVAVATPGMFARPLAWWQARSLADLDGRHGRANELQCVVLEAEDDGSVAYALYRINFAFTRGLPTGAVHVIEALGSSVQATCALWRYLLDIDLTASVRAGPLPVDHPLFLLAAEPRQLRGTIRDGLWLRLVDVEAALAARTYAAPHHVVVELTDAFCPWNAGRWRLGADGAHRTSDTPELRCEVTALASVYLGGFTWTQLAAALGVEELRPGALAHADALFQTAVAPWCPEIF